MPRVNRGAVASVLGAVRESRKEQEAEEQEFRQFRQKLLELGIRTAIERDTLEFKNQFDLSQAQDQRDFDAEQNRLNRESLESRAQTTSLGALQRKVADRPDVGLRPDALSTLGMGESFEQITPQPDPLTLPQQANVVQDIGGLAKNIQAMEQANTEAQLLNQQLAQEQQVVQQAASRPSALRLAMGPLGAIQNLMRMTSGLRTQAEPAIQFPVTDVQPLQDLQTRLTQSLTAPPTGPVSQSALPAPAPAAPPADPTVQSLASAIQQGTIQTLDDAIEFLTTQGLNPFDPLYTDLLAPLP